jgi:hypothetical protein
LTRLAVANFVLALSVKEIAEQAGYDDSDTRLVFGHGGNRWHQGRHHEGEQIRGKEK